MGTLLEDIDTGAEWIASALRSSGYAADFRPPSLWEIDRFFDDQIRDGKPRRGGLLSTDLGSRIFALGAYTGEVIRRDRGGLWRTDPAGSEDERDLELAVPSPTGDETVCWPVQRVMKRFTNGPEDGIAVYGQAFGLEIGPAPEPARKRRLFGR